MPNHRMVSLYEDVTMRYADVIVGMVSLIIIQLPGKTAAQTGCANFGDPIIHITFGNIDSPMTQLPENATDYLLYQGGGQFMRPNYYTITNNAQSAGSVFHSFTDHTGDAGGGMLLVNADYQPGVFYTEVQRDLCPNTDFTFSAWVINASPPDLCGTVDSTLKPNVLFEIRTLSGDLIADLPTGVIHGQTSPEWQYYEVSFNTGEHTDVVLVMRNVGPGGCGNNLAIDDIQFRPCGPQLDLIPSLGITADNTVLLCMGNNEVTLESGIGRGYDTPVYQWQEREEGSDIWRDIVDAGRPSLTVSPVNGTWYRLTVAANAASLQNPKCRVVSGAIRVARAQSPALTLTPETLSVCLGTVQPLEPGEFVWPDTGPLNYQWYERDNDGGGWRLLHGANAGAYTPVISEAGVYAYQRQAVNTCGVTFPVDEFVLAVQPLTATTLDLPIDLFCTDSPEIHLTGGLPERFDGQPGVYSGPGVEKGIFYPRRAGVGQHVVTYAPPSGFDCPSPSTMTVTVLDAVYVESMPDHVILKGNSIQLIPKTNAVHFSWDSGSPGLSDYAGAAPVAAPALTTVYSLTVTDAAGCQQTTSVTVRVLEHLNIPNSFTPNGDGVNDVWDIDGLAQYPNTHVQVYNRWGALVFSSKGYAVAWDGQSNGTPLPAATYYYTVSSGLLEKPLSGAVTILR